MNCDEARLILTEILDGRCSDRDVVREHLCACPPCRDFEAGLAGYKEMMRSYAAQPVPEISSGFDSGFYIRSDALRRRTAVSYLKPAFALAALLVAVFAGSRFMGRGRVSSADAFVGEALTQAQEDEMAAQARVQAENILGRFM